MVRALKGHPHPLAPPMQPSRQTLDAPDAPDAPAASADVDVKRKFVRVIDERADGLVAFEFAIGWPELSVELLLPAAAFTEFCTTNRVQRLDH